MGTGKHGHARAVFVGIHLFNGKKHEDACPSSHTMEVPVVKRTEYLLSMLDETDGSVSVITESGELKTDLNLPTFGRICEPTTEDVQLHKSIVQGYQAGRMVTVAVLSACGMEKIVSAKMSD